MSDPEGQEPTVDDPVSPTPAPADPPAGSPTLPAETFSRDYVEQLRREAAANRKRAAELEARLKTDDEAKLSEHERLTRRAAEAEQRAVAAEQAAATLRIRAEIERQARALGCVDEEAAYRLLDLTTVECDSSGLPLNAKALVRELLDKRPWLKQPRPTQPVPSTPTSTGAPDRAAAVTKTQQELQASGIFGSF